MRIRPRGPRALTPNVPSSVTVAGTVGDWAGNHHGDLDGFFLDSGEQVRFPPHLGSDVTAFVATGDEVTVLGVEHTPPDGDTHIVAYTIETVRGRLSLDIADHPPRHRHIPANAPVRANGASRFVNDDGARFAAISARLDAIEALLVNRLHDEGTQTDTSENAER